MQPVYENLFFGRIEEEEIGGLHPSTALEPYYNTQSCQQTIQPANNRQVQIGALLCEELIAHVPEIACNGGVILIIADVEVDQHHVWTEIEGNHVDFLHQITLEVFVELHARAHIQRHPALFERAIDVRVIYLLIVLTSTVAGVGNLAAVKVGIQVGIGVKVKSRNENREVVLALSQNAAVGIRFKELNGV